MCVQFVLLFLTALNYAAGYGGFLQQAQNWSSEYSSEKQQLHTAFGVGGLTDPPAPLWAINQGNGIRDSPNPQQYLNQPQQYLNQAQQYASQPQRFVTNPQQYANEPQAYVNQRQQYANQPNHHANQLQQYANQPEQYANQPQQYLNQPQQYASQPQRFVTNPQQYANEPQAYVNQRQQYANQPQQYLNQPQQFVNQPQPEYSLGHFYNYSTVPPPPLPPPFIPPQFRPAENSSSNKDSEKNCDNCATPKDDFVSGGSYTKRGEFPYMAAIGYRRQRGGYDYQCGGTLISTLFVLTAAHCRISGGQLAAVVKLGGDNLDDDYWEYDPIEIMDIIVHPNYKRKQVYDDIALLRLKKATRLESACLWTNDYINYNTATAIGYGQTAFGSSTSNYLFKVDLQLYSSQVCQQYYTPRFRIERGLIDTQLCAGDFNRVKDTCPGDSGGPLLVKIKVNETVIPFILGVTSFGPGCAEGIPGVYTKVSSYFDWIEPIVWPERFGFMLECTVKWGKFLGKLEETLDIYKNEKQP